MMITGITALELFSCCDDRSISFSRDVLPSHHRALKTIAAHPMMTVNVVICTCIVLCNTGESDGVSPCMQIMDGDLRCRVLAK